MNMDFDKIVERKGTFSEKVDGLGKHYGKDDLIPLWVADMDFESPQCVKEALQEVVNTSVYGYNTIPDEYFPTIAAWLEQEHGWKAELPWLSFIPGVVKGIGYVINFFHKARRRDCSHASGLSSVHKRPKQERQETALLSAEGAQVRRVRKSTLL